MAENDDLRILSGRPLMYQLETANGSKELPLYPFSLGKIVLFLEKVAILVAEVDTIQRTGQEGWTALFRKKDWQGVLSGLLQQGRDGIAELVQIAFEPRPIVPGQYTALTREEAIWGMTLPGLVKLMEDLYRLNEMDGLLKKILVLPGDSGGDLPSPPSAKNTDGP